MPGIMEDIDRSTDPDYLRDLPEPEEADPEPSATSEARPTFMNLPETQRPQLRVGFLTPSLGMGGAERWIISLTKHFRGAYTSVVGMIGSSYHISLAEELSRFAPIYSQHYIPGGQRVADIQEVVARTFAESDVVLSWDIRTAELIKNQTPKPLVDVAHNDYDFPDQVEMAKESFKKAQVVVGVSTSCVQVYPPGVRDYGHVLYNGAEIDRVTPRKGRARARETWGISDNAKVILFMGRMAKQKQPQRVIQTIARLPEDWIAIMIGHGDLRSQVEAAAQQFAPGRILFMPSSTHVGDFLAAGDVFMLPSLNEGMPIVMPEAWMAGIPCVFSDFNCINELEMFHGQPLCWKVSKKAPVELWVRAVQEAYQAGRTSERVAVARSLAWTNYTATTMAYRWEQFLTWVVRHWHDLHTEMFAVTERRLKLPGEFNDNSW